MNERAQQLLSAYQADTGPEQAREDALFESIVRRIVTDETASELEHGDEDEPAVEETPPTEQRGRRAIVLPVALATAAIAAGLVLAMSLRGQIVTQTDGADRWQAPNVEDADPAWWRRVVPSRWLGDPEEEVAPVESDLEDESTAMVPIEAPAVSPAVGSPVPAAAAAPRSSAPRARAMPEPAAAVPAPSDGDGWGAPAARQGAEAPSGKPSRGPRQTGGGMPSGGGGTSAPKKDDDSGKRDRSKASKPSTSRPGPTSPSGSGGSSPPPSDPPPADPPPPDPPPGPPPADPCEEVFEACQTTNPGPHCDYDYQECVGDGSPCEVEYHECVQSGLPEEQCAEHLTMCGDPMPAEDMCFDHYETCALAGGHPEGCLDEFAMCLDGAGGAWPGACPELGLRCEQSPGPVACADVMAICEDSMGPGLECEQTLNECLEVGDPETMDMCHEAYDECMAEPFWDAPPEDGCDALFEGCLEGGDPIQCEAEFVTCIAP